MSESPIFNLSPYEGHPSSLPIVSEPNDLSQTHSWETLAVPVLVEHSTDWGRCVRSSHIYATDAITDFGLFGWRGVDKSMKISATNEIVKEENVVLGKLELKCTGGIRRAAPDVPLPTEYGVYAVANGRLTELDLLPIKAPDQRVAVSASISTPSRVHLPKGQLQFVIFRRDLVANAPDRVSVRVVARVARALTFSSAGNAKVANGLRNCALSGEIPTK